MSFISTLSSSFFRFFDNHPLIAKSCVGLIKKCSDVFLKHPIATTALLATAVIGTRAVINAKWRTIDTAAIPDEQQTPELEGVVDNSVLNFAPRTSEPDASAAFSSLTEAPDEISARSSQAPAGIAGDTGSCEDINLICLYDRLRQQIPSAPNFNGSTAEKTASIRSWLRSHSALLEGITELNLNALGLTKLPQEIFLFKNLRYLSLANNQLTTFTLPESSLGNLQTLDLSHNQLATFTLPEGSLGNLQYLYLSHNQLATFTLPEGSLGNLQYLSLCHNHLTTFTFPERSLVNLQILHLFHNHLTTFTFPERSLVNLQILNLSFNPLTTFTLPEGSLVNLRDLNLSCNHLTTFTLPEGSLGNLHVLELSHNYLTTFTLPAGSLGNLQTLYLSINQLTSLPDTMLRWSRSCSVVAQNNHFTAEYVTQFAQSLRQVREQNSAQGPYVELSIYDHQVHTISRREDQLRLWSNEISQNEQHQSLTEPQFNKRFASLLNLESSKKELLSHYLEKLRGTADYRNPTAQADMIRKVDRMLTLACQNQGFRDMMLAIITEGLETCGDRTIIVFNDIEVQWQMHQTLSVSDARQLAIRAQRYEELKKYAQKVANDQHLHDPIETILYFQINLRDALDLPITIQGMLYPRCSGVDEEMLSVALSIIRNLSDEELLSRSDFWRSRSSNEIRAQIERSLTKINERYVRILELAQKYYNNNSPQDREQFLNQNDAELRRDPDIAEEISSIISDEEKARFLSRCRDEYAELATIVRMPNITDYSAAAFAIAGKRTSEITRAYSAASRG